MEEFIVLGIVVVLFTSLGILFLSGRGSFLIAGYNTMAKKKKEKYDEKALCRFVGWLLIIISLCVILLSIGMYLEKDWIIHGGTIFMLAIVIGSLTYANTNNRFKK